MNRKITLIFLATFLLFTIAWSQNSPTISKVLDYKPAPGQHINMLFPTSDRSNSYEDALRFANDALVNNKGMLGLGGFGGYVVVGFDHPIVNLPGEYDFKGFGNSFEGSAEPGIVMVCQDVNKNGLPDADEPWYELAGSEYNHPETVQNYEITYYKPSVPKSDVKWNDNQGNEGVVKHIVFATQDYMYPNWIAEKSITFRGTKLRNTAHDMSGNGSHWVLSAFDYGYIDNNSNQDPIEKNGFKIDWAVDESGKKVDLAYIDFIKIYTAQVQEAGWLGETSTEVTGIVDLHPEAIISSTPTLNINSPKVYVAKNQLVITGVEVFDVKIYNLAGHVVANRTQISNLKTDIYIVKIITGEGSIITEKITI